jgi:methyltransferase (TIGR00027 family)
MGSLTSVGKTAVGVARVRAAESRRPDRLFDDPYASAFVAAAGVTFPEGRGYGKRRSVGNVFATHTILRTRFYDEYLLAAAGAGCAQVVLLAAGLDARAFRLGFPAGVTVFELDVPEMLEFKEQVLAAESAEPRCARVVVPADLREDWASALRAAGFHPERPTAWLVEGLLVYLTAEEAARLLETVGSLSAAGSQVAFEHAPVSRDSLLAAAGKVPGMREYARLWHGGLGERTGDWMTGHGWTVTITGRGEFAARVGRAEPDNPGSGGFLTATR